MVPRRTCERARVVGEAPVVGSGRPTGGARAAWWGYSGGRVSSLSLVVHGSVRVRRAIGSSRRVVSSFRVRARPVNSSSRLSSSRARLRVCLPSCLSRYRSARSSVCPSVRPYVVARNRGHRVEFRETGLVVRRRARETTRTHTRAHARTRSVFEMRRKPAVPTAAAESSIAPHVRVS